MFRIDVGHEHWDFVIPNFSGLRLLVHHVCLEAEALHLDLGLLFRVQVLEDLLYNGKEVVAVFLPRQELAVQLQVSEELAQSDYCRLILRLKENCTEF